MLNTELCICPLVLRGMISEKVRHNFDQRGVVVVSGVTAEKALELAIEAGAEDVQETGDEDEKPQLKVRSKFW